MHRVFFLSRGNVSLRSTKIIRDEEVGVQIGWFDEPSEFGPSGSFSEQTVRGIARVFFVSLPLGKYAFPFPFAKKMRATSLASRIPDCSAPSM
jgi:hypothetical protein